jgi:tRNA G18 (ribose-2'-O)-methylase SpoU
VFITRPRLDSLWPDLQALPAGTPIFTADQDLMNGIVGFNIHRGVLAAGERPADPDLDLILASSATLLILEDLANHDNVGGIFRATAALGGIAVLGSASSAGASVLLSPRCCDPLYRKAIRVSMGAALQVPFSRLTPWPATLEDLRSRDWTLVALTPDPAAIPIDQLPPIPRPALMLGAEGPGLTDSALAAAGIRVRIPISPAVDSLNVVTAAAIALHRLARP